jgi:microcystin-dependent protein
MAQPFLGEIKTVGFNFPPRGWAQTNGQLLSISQNNALFSLLATTYGGNGQTTFALPDIRSRMPLHQGTGAQLSARTMGQMGGAEAATFPLAQIPGAPVTPITALASPTFQVLSLSPFLVVNFVIALQGVFPSRN